MFGGGIGATLEAFPIPLGSTNPVAVCQLRRRLLGLLPYPLRPSLNVQLRPNRLRLAQMKRRAWPRPGTML
jgi:hypothetical protein